jgi:hypothetical protein
MVILFLAAGKSKSLNRIQILKQANKAITYTGIKHASHAIFLSGV